MNKIYRKTALRKKTFTKASLDNGAEACYNSKAPVRKGAQVFISVIAAMLAVTESDSRVSL